jgi:hypothetical protein
VDGGHIEKWRTLGVYKAFFVIKLFLDPDNLGFSAFIIELVCAILEYRETSIPVHGLWRIQNGRQRSSGAIGN